MSSGGDKIRSLMESIYAVEADQQPIEYSKMQALIYDFIFSHLEGPKDAIKQIYVLAKSTDEFWNPAFDELHGWLKKPNYNLESDIAYTLDAVANGMKEYAKNQLGVELGGDFENADLTWEADWQDLLRKLAPSFFESAEQVYTPVEENMNHSMYFDWKESPEDVIKQINKSLKKHGLKIVVDNRTGGDYITAEIVSK